MATPFFPERAATPTIYAYRDTHPQYAGLLKVGYTTQGAVARVREQYPTLRPGALPYEIVLEETALRADGSAFSDHDVHRWLRANGVRHEAGEWFRCAAADVRAALLALRTGQANAERRTDSFGMRPEQEAAVAKTAAYFRREATENPDRTPHFLWNAKMRFGKTFAAYQLARRLGWTRILVLTFKPAVQNAWADDLRGHVDFAGWQFIAPGPDGLRYESADRKRPIVCFGSFQDYLGRNESTGGIKTKNEWVHATPWDCVVLDEYHYGAWRESAKDLFEAEAPGDAVAEAGKGLEYYDEAAMPITAGAYLYLSGTPFRAIASGEFIEEQIFNWTYSDEQRAKAAWPATAGPNPYAALPRLVMLTYQLPDALRDIARRGEFDEFDLNLFFAADGTGAAARFKYENEVQKWLNLIRGSYAETAVDTLRLGSQKPALPFAHAPLLRALLHTFWFLPSVASCHAMKNLLGQRQNTFYHDYAVVVAAGPAAGLGAEALKPVLAAMTDPLHAKTITLSCGKLTTGVSVKPWTGIFMLRNSSSPETYFQAAFRVQTPWTAKNPDQLSPNREVVLKEECYVFDFAPDRALRQIADYGCRLNPTESNPETNVAEFIKFLPVLAYDGSTMKEISAADVLDMALSGTSATLLARRWESALLVNVDNNTLQRLLSNPAAMKALESIEGFRNLNQDIETIINKSEAVKKAKKEANGEELGGKAKKALSDEEKEYKSLRKQIQDKLIKFAARVPVFMYLTDYREYSLKDVITQLEPDLFRKVTGLSIVDFELLVSLDVFNSGMMNDAVYKFKRYEDASLEYAGLSRHANGSVGLFNTVIGRAEYESGLG